MSDCIHRMSLKSTQRCGSCQGNVQVKVFGCAIHRMCSVGKAVYARTPGRYMVCEEPGKDPCPDKLTNEWVHSVEAIAVAT